MTDWVIVGTDVMREARSNRGLSYESASRLLHVSSKTYERREKMGRWPRQDIAGLAEVLGLEIERRPAPRVSVVDEADEFRALHEKVDQMVAILERIDDKVDGIEIDVSLLAAQYPELERARRSARLQAEAERRR